MNRETSPELPTFKEVPYEDPNETLSLAVQGAVKIGGLHNDTYLGNSSKHLPVVTISQTGSHESIEIGRGHVFSAAIDGPESATVKQFDAKTGKLLSEDDMELGSDTHIVFDPQSGKRTLATHYDDDYPVAIDHFDKNGVLQTSDGDSFHNEYNSQGQLEKSIKVYPILNDPGHEVNTSRYEANGTEITTTTFPGSEHSTYVYVVHPDQSRDRVDFDSKTGKANEVQEIKAQGPPSFFKIDEQTGKASPDYWQDFLAYLH